jgi:hypothetical protein
MRQKIKRLVQDHPIIATVAAAAAGYYGGPPAQAALAKVWTMFAG